MESCSTLVKARLDCVTSYDLLRVGSGLISTILATALVASHRSPSTSLLQLILLHGFCTAMTAVYLTLEYHRVQWPRYYLSATGLPTVTIMASSLFTDDPLAYFSTWVHLVLIVWATLVALQWPGRELPEPCRDEEATTAPGQDSGLPHRTSSRADTW